MSDLTKPNLIPWWIWLVIAIEVIVPAYFGVATIFDPSIWGEDHFGAMGQLYVTRNFTMVLALVVALILRSRVALFVALLARYVTDFADITAGFIRGPDPETFQVLAVFAGVLLVLPLFALVWLFRHRSAG